MRAAKKQEARSGMVGVSGGSDEGEERMKESFSLLVHLITVDFKQGRAHVWRIESLSTLQSSADVKPKVADLDHFIIQNCQLKNNNLQRWISELLS